MRKKSVAIVGLCLAAGYAIVTDWQSAPPSPSATPAPAVINTSMLRPGMTCKIGVDSPTGAFSNCYYGYLGMVAEVNETEIVLDDAIYQVIAKSEITREVGTVRIPVTEVASIHFSGAVPEADGTLVERIGVEFR